MDHSRAAKGLVLAVPMYPHAALPADTATNKEGKNREMTTEASLFGLAEKKAMVIGGGQGMGESTSRFLARAGCDVAIIDIERERAERVAGLVGELGRQGVTIVGNVLNDAEIPTIVASAE